VVFPVWVARVEHDGLPVVDPTGHRERHRPEVANQDPLALLAAPDRNGTGQAAGPHPLDCGAAPGKGAAPRRVGSTPKTLAIDKSIVRAALTVVRERNRRPQDWGAAWAHMGRLLVANPRSAEGSAGAFPVLFGKRTLTGQRAGTVCL
jgi:hypothetical protein